ncbi:hypothetical protein DF186_16015, partial [Enterococcus hirae]
CQEIFVSLSGICRHGHGRSTPRGPEMAKYRMTMMHGRRDSEGIHDFEEADDLLTHSPMTVLRRSLEAVETREGVGHVDFEANAALKNDAAG